MEHREPDKGRSGHHADQQQLPAHVAPEQHVHLGEKRQELVALALVQMGDEIRRLVLQPGSLSHVDHADQPIVSQHRRQLRQPVLVIHDECGA